FVLIRAMAILRDWLRLIPAASSAARIVAMRFGFQPGDELFHSGRFISGLSCNFHLAPRTARRTVTSHSLTTIPPDAPAVHGHPAHSPDLAAMVDWPPGDSADPSAARERRHSADASPEPEAAASMASRRARRPSEDAAASEDWANLPSSPSPPPGSPAGSL